MMPPMAPEAPSIAAVDAMMLAQGVNGEPERSDAI